MKNSLQACTKALDNYGLDVFDVGCKWQEKTAHPDMSGNAVVLVILLAGLLVVWFSGKPKSVD